MYRLMWLIVFLGWAGSLPAQDRTVVMPDGTLVATDRVSLLGTLPTSCIALEAEGGSATIVLSRQTLELLAARDVHALERKVSRVELLASGRARELLKFLAPGRDRFGCQRLRGKPPMNTSFLVGWLLEQGRAVVFTPRFSGPEPAIIVRHTDTSVSGFEDFRLLDGTVIWSYGVWVH